MSSPHSQGPQQAQLDKTDYLTQLPAELFITICELVRDSWKGPYLGRVSKAFLPVARRFTFRKVTVRSYTALAQLCDVLITSPGAALHVNELEILLFDTAVDNGALKTATFNKAMSQLKGASKLTLHYSSRLVKSVLAPVSGMLESLHRLSIVDRFEGWSNPLDPTNFRHLGPYRLLSRLDVDVKRSVESLGRYRPAKNLPRLSLGWALWLTGPLSSNNAVSDLPSCFVYIGNVGLNDTAPATKATVPALLGKVHSPYWIQDLSLQQAADDPSPRAEAISSFRRLQSLELWRGTWSSAMLPVLHNLDSLEELYFQEVPISIDDVRAMLDGPQKISKLKRVYLNVTTYDYWNVYDLRWTPGFSLDGLVDLLPVAERVGVRLEGNAADTARAEVKVREQRERNAAAAAGRAAASRGGR
ncbi:hypothetical protein JCM9279_005163 [Rhodotorula babjevae]